MGTNAGYGKIGNIAMWIQRLILVIGFLTLISSAFAGKLEEFERDATRDRSHERRTRYDPYYDDPYYHRHHHRHYPDQRDRSSGSGFTLLDVSGDEHEPGGPILPYLRLDAAYQKHSSNIDAGDYYAQIGYGFLGLDTRFTRFREKYPDDRLNISRIHGLLRLGGVWGDEDFAEADGGYWEVDFGLGMVQLDGDHKNDGFSFTMPILFYLTDYLGFEFRPAWASIKHSKLRDYDLSVHLTLRYVGVKIGHRWLKSPSQSLNGPYAGLVFRY